MIGYIEIDEDQFAKEMARAFYDRLRFVLNADYHAAVRDRIKNEVAIRVKREPEYTSLVSGQLRGELGVIDGVGAVNDMIEGLVSPPNGLEILVDGPRLFGDKISCSVAASILQEDYTEVINRARASFGSRGGVVPWLKWLLVGGNSVLISDYVYLGKKPVPSSRTGMGVMRKSSLGWGLKSVGGTVGDNWLVRALDSMHTVLANILQDEIIRRFG